MDFLFLAIGLSLLLTGANYLVESSVAIAQRAKISDFIIGLTIVGIGTSAPELFISVKSSFSGFGDMSVGNVLGSNICNTLLILGVTSAICPFFIERSTLRRDIPMSIFASLLFVFLILDNSISRIDALVLLIAFVAYMWNAVKGQCSGCSNEENQKALAKKNIFVLILIAIVSLAILIYVGNLLVDSAVALASAWGISQRVISITIVAVGTSLPELVTCLIAALKGNPQLALGNVLGSNIFNILLIPSISAAIAPISLTDIQGYDMAMLVLSAILAYIVSLTFGRNKFDRIEGIIFLLIYVGYTTLLFIR